MKKVLHRIENGHGREDIDLLLSIQSKIEGIPFVH
jgi:hypothetical protein